MSPKFITFLLIIILILSVILAKDLIVTKIFEKTVEAISGLKIRAGYIDVGIFNTSIRVKDLIILNPASFPDQVLAEINQLYVNYDFASGFNREIHIGEMIFDVKLVNVIKNDKGELNLNSLKIIKLLQDAGKAKGERPNSGMPKIKIDKLHLKGGKVIYKDYTRKPAPNITEFSIEVDERYENITDPYELVSLLVSRSLVKTSPSTAIGFDLTPLQNQFQDVMAKSVEAIKNTTEQFKKALQLDK